MAAPNTLIINSRTIVNAGHEIRGVNIAADSFISVGQTAMYTASFVTPYITTNTLQLNGTAAITGSASINGTVFAGALSTSGTLTAGATTFNSTVRLGNILLQNNLAKVGRSTVEDGGINTPYIGVTDMSAAGTTTTNVLNSTTSFLNGSTFYNGQSYHHLGQHIQFRNASNGAIYASFGVQSDGLLFLNAHNADSSFKATLLRYSTGPSTSDNILSLGASTRIGGNLTVDVNLTASGSGTFGSNLQVNGSTNISGALTIGSQTIMQNFEARNDSRIINGAQPSRGVLFMGNGDKHFTWDGANWVARGGSFFISNLVSEGNIHASANLQINGNANINGGLTVGAHVNPTTITTSAWIRTGAEIRITGYGSGGLLRFGPNDGAYQLYDAGRFRLAGGNVEVDNDVYANSVVVRGGNLWTHRNSAYGILYFGNGYNSYLEYNGAGLLTVPHDFTTAGTFRGVNLLASSSVNSNTMGANYIRSAGNVDAAGDMNANGVVNGGRLHSFGNIGANGTIGAPMLEASHHIINNGTTYFRGGHTRWGSDDGLYLGRDGGWLATNASFRTDGAGQIRAGGDMWAFGGALITGSSQEMVLRGEPWSKNGVIFTTSTKLIVENVYCYTLNYQSDITMKDVRGEFMADAEALSKITQLEPIKYTWKPDVRSDSGILHYGFSAQQVQTVLPDLVTENSDKLSVAHIEMLPLMVASIRELKREIEELRSQVATTENTKNTTRRKKV